MNHIEQLQVAGSHYDVGFAIGQRFARQIHQAIDVYPFFQEKILPYHNSPEGQARFRQLLDLHRDHYPGYVEELEGIARGAERSFKDLFLVNLRGEYRGYVRDLQPRGCADCALVTEAMALIGHNEDGSPAFRDNIYIVHAKVDGKPGFSAFTYAGFVCGNAFGFDTDGICFSVDNVRPRNIRVGLGRHFIARSLLEASSLDDAIRRVTVDGRASGFTYTIGSIPERRVVQVEVAPDAHHVREIRGGNFHANHYQDLTNVEQIIVPSSRARVERAGVLMETHPPVDRSGVLAILGDQANREYPIRRTATPPDQGETYCTALFDLDARKLLIYTDHPIRNPRAFIEIAM